MINTVYSRNFVKIWNNSKTLEEVAKIFSKSKNYLSQLASLYRSSGMNLKYFQNRKLVYRTSKYLAREKCILPAAEFISVYNMCENTKQIVVNLNHTRTLKTIRKRAYNYRLRGLDVKKFSGLPEVDSKKFIAFWKSTPNYAAVKKEFGISVEHTRRLVTELKLDSICVSKRKLRVAIWNKCRTMVEACRRLRKRSTYLRMEMVRNRAAGFPAKYIGGHISRENRKKRLEVIRQKGMRM